MAGNRAVSSHLDRGGWSDSVFMRVGRKNLRAESDSDGADDYARPYAPTLRCDCNIREMPERIQIKCAITGCHRRLKMTLAQRGVLRRVGLENNATAGLVCPVHVKAAFNFEFNEIDIDVPLEELLVEASKETPRWRVILTPLTVSAGEPDCQSTPGQGDRVI